MLVIVKLHLEIDILSIILRCSPHWCASVRNEAFAADANILFNYVYSILYSAIAREIILAGSDTTRTKSLPCIPKAFAQLWIFCNTTFCLPEMG